MLNVKLLNDTLSWAEGEWEKTCRGESSEWDQAHWIAVSDCGTTACMAGRIVITELGIDAVDLDTSRMGTAIDYAEGFVVGYEVTESVDGCLAIGSVAAHLLGLEDPELAEALFYDSTTIEHVRDVVAQIKEAHARGEI